MCHILSGSPQHRARPAQQRRGPSCPSRQSAKSHWVGNTVTAASGNSCRIPWILCHLVSSQPLIWLNFTHHFCAQSSEYSGGQRTQRENPILNSGFLKGPNQDSPDTILVSESLTNGDKILTKLLQVLFSHWITCTCVGSVCTCAHTHAHTYSHRHHGAAGKEFWVLGYVLSLAPLVEMNECI